MTETFEKEIVQRITRNLPDIQMLRLIQSQPMWGYLVKRRVQKEFGLKLRHGALYPLLNRMELRGFLTSKKQKHKGRTRKVYKITRKGIQYLEAYNRILKEQMHGKDIK